MALYVDSAYLDDIIAVAQIIPVSGVTTNPTLMLNASQRGQKLSPRALLNELLHHLPEGTIFIQPGATQAEEMYNEALAYINVNPQRVVPKIPLTVTGIRVARQIKQQEYRLSFTAVTSLAQAYSAAMVPVDYIIPYYNRLSRAGVDASQRIHCMAQLFAQQHLAPRILAASIKTPIEAANALLAGAHDLTVAPDVLYEMVTDPESEAAVERFSQDWRKMNKL
ncbi:transaldolase family protein [Ktedonospora formicarum]|uniref:Fructose-6-phosphate aldolase n=1 Tax=Ktedonospora formicarum TaxID=2778364 RepID=A0A8J3MQM8_9CHLR|nr:transaldolase family protein [Ktedonospora formicarum]GHO44125.1 fructose-6-phosphate aldolase [Ktedonospora formicarum]